MRCDCIRGEFKWPILNERVLRWVEDMDVQFRPCI